MTFNENQGDREHTKFVETDAGETAVRVKAFDSDLSFDGDGNLLVGDKRALAELKSIKELLVTMVKHLECITQEKYNGNTDRW